MERDRFRGLTSTSEELSCSQSREYHKYRRHRLLNPYRKPAKCISDSRRLEANFLFICVFMQRSRPTEIVVRNTSIGNRHARDNVQKNNAIPLVSLYERSQRIPSLLPECHNTHRGLKHSNLDCSHSLF